MGHSYHSPPPSGTCLVGRNLPVLGSVPRNAAHLLRLDLPPPALVSQHDNIRSPPVRNWK